MTIKLSDIERPWLDKASLQALRFIMECKQFNSDALRVFVSQRSGVATHNNLWGVLLARLRNSGLIHRIGYTRSRRLAANGRTIAVWMSRV